MALTYNGVTPTAITYNGTALDKLIFNGVTVWENWKEYTLTKTAPSSGIITDSDFTTSQYVQFTNDGTYKITSVTGIPRVYSHGDNVEVYAYATIEVSDDGNAWTQVTKTEQERLIGEIGKTYTGKTISHSWSDGCPYKYIRVYCKGTSTKRMITGTFSGYKKGA